MRYSKSKFAEFVATIVVNSLISIGIISIIYTSIDNFKLFFLFVFISLSFQSLLYFIQKIAIHNKKTKEEIKEYKIEFLNNIESPFNYLSYKFVGTIEDLNEETKKLDAKGYIYKISISKKGE